MMHQHSMLSLLFYSFDWTLPPPWRMAASRTVKHSSKAQLLRTCLSDSSLPWFGRMRLCPPSLVYFAYFNCFNCYYKLSIISSLSNYSSHFQLSPWMSPSFSPGSWGPPYQYAPYEMCQDELWHFTSFIRSCCNCSSHCFSGAVVMVSVRFWLLMSLSILFGDPGGANRKAWYLIDFASSCWVHHLCGLMFLSALGLFSASPSSRTWQMFLPAYFQILKSLDSTYWDSKLQEYRYSM